MENRKSSKLLERILHEDCWDALSLETPSKSIFVQGETREMKMPFSSAAIRKTIHRHLKRKTLGKNVASVFFIIGSLFVFVD